MARLSDEISVDDPPPDMPSVLREQRTRLAALLTPPSPRPSPSPLNPTVDFVQRAVRGEPLPGPAPQPSEPQELPSFVSGILGGIGEFAGAAGRYLTDPRERARAREGLRSLPGEDLLPPFLRSTEIMRGVGEFAETLPGFAEQNAQLEGKLGPDVPSIIPGGAFAAGVVRKGRQAIGAAEDVVPGVLRTAEQRIAQTFAQRQAVAGNEIAENAMRLTQQQTARVESNIAKGALDVPAPQRTRDEVFREIGSNLGKLEVDEPVKEIILANAARNYDDIARLSFTDQRRGVQTIAEQWEKARRIIPDLTLEESLATRPGTAMNAETLLAAQSALIGKADDVLGTAGRLAENINDADKARLIVEMTELSALQRVFAGGRAEAGRALRALRESVRPGESPRSMWEAASKFIGGREKGDEVVRGLVDIWTDPRFVGDDLARDGAVFSYLRGLDQPGAIDFILEVRRNALLSSPITFVVNTIGNTSVLAAERTVTRTAQAGWESVLAAMGRRPEGREVFFSEVFPGLMGMTAGFGRGLRQAKLIAQAKMTPEQVSKFVEQGLLPKGEATEALLRQAHLPQPIAGTVSAVVNIPTRGMAAADALAYEMAWSGELYAQAARATAKEGLRGAKFDTRIAQLIAKPTEAMLKAATEHAKLVTLKSDPSAIARGILRLRTDKNPLVKTAAHIIFPFVQAPDNLIKLGGSYSPLGFIDAAIGSGRAGGAARSAALARAAVGTVGMYAFFLSKLQAGEIDVTAGLPQDEKERAQFYAEGKVPYAVRIGTQWVQFSRLEPFATPIKWMAAARDVYERNGRTVDPVVAAQMVGAGMRATLDASYLTGLTDLIEVLENPSEEKVSAFLARTGGGFIPFSSLLRTTAYANDPFYRDPEGAIQRIEAQLPWTYQNVPPVLQVTGEAARRPESKQGALGFVNPILVSPEQHNAILSTLNTLTTPETLGPKGEKIPGEPLRLGFPSEEIRNLKLTTDEGRRLDEVAQSLAMRQLETLFTTPDFKGSQPWRQRELAEKAINDTRQIARGLVADEIVNGAKTPAEAARGAVMKVGTIEGDGIRTRIGAVAEYVTSLRTRGVLTSEVKAELDRTRRAAESLTGKPDPTVDEMLKAVPALRAYLNEPPYGTRAKPYGNAQEWALLAEKRKSMSAYLSANPKPPNVLEWVWYAKVDREGAQLIRRYQLVGPSRERTRIAKANPEIERYLKSSSVFE